MCTSFRLGDLSRFQTLESTETGTYRRIHSWLKELPQQSPSRRKQKLHISWACGEFSCPIYIMSTSSYHSVAICGRFAHWEYWDIELQQSSDWDFSNEIHVPICFVIAAATNMFEQDSKGLSTVWKALNSSAGTCRLCLLAFYYCPQWTLGAKATRTLAAERVIVHIFGAEPRLMPKKQNDLWCLPTCCSWDSRVSWHYLFPSRRESALYVLYQRRQQWYCTKGLWLKTSPCHNLPKFI